MKGHISRTLTETVSLLARMARFIIADVTAQAASRRNWRQSFLSLRYPARGRGTALFDVQELLEYEWVLPVHRYEAWDHRQIRARAHTPSDRRAALAHDFSQRDERGKRIIHRHHACAGLSETLGHEAEIGAL